MEKGFTLVELLIVIGILAVLTAAVVVVLNPAQLLAQARDSQRFADLDAVQTAIIFWLATASSPTFGNSGTTYCTAMGTPDSGSCTGSNPTSSVNGNGWIRANLTQATGGSPLAALPQDPSNGTTYFYVFENDGTNFELNCNLESTKYSGKEQTDGGDSATWYEVGTDPDLNLI